MPPPTLVYVDRASACPESDGSAACPFKTFCEGYDVVATCGSVRMRAGTYAACRRVLTKCAVLESGGGRVTLVCGGGNFAEEARLAHAHWRFDKGPHAHNMALLTLAQAGYLALCLEPKLRAAVSEASVRQILRAGQVAVWLPLESLLGQAGDGTAPGFTSDRVALELAGRLNAERLILVKSGVLDTTASVSELSRVGVLHGCFTSIAKRVGFPISVVHSNDLARMRSMLHGEAEPVSTT